MTYEPYQDLRPAFFCSEAVLIAENEDVAKYLNEARDKYPMDIRFDRVHVSVDQEADPRGIKFLVAYGREVTFIAFRGACDFEAPGRNTEKPLTSSDLHTTVQDLTGSFLGPYSNLLEELSRSGKRIIFCGHRLGGAVAQMVTVCFWKDREKGTIKSEEKPVSLVAISFGAPQIWDSLHTVDFSLLKNRLFNVPNDEDPLGSLLKDGLQGPHPESPTLGIQGTGKSRRVSSATSHWVLGKSVKPWNKTMFKKCYESAVEDVLEQAKFSGLNDSADPPFSEIVVESSAPQVISAIRKASDSGSIITITGSNLLFLRGKVKLDGLHPWDTLTQTDKKLRIFSSEKTKPEDIKNSVSKVTIKTAFGGTSHDVSEANTDEESNEGPLRCLSKIVQMCSMLATPGPFCIPASDEVLAALDSIVQCARDLIKGVEKTLSTLFRERAKSPSNIEEMNALVKKVTNFLETSYEIHYHKGNLKMCGALIGGALVVGGLVLIPIGGVAIAGIATTGAVVTMGAGGMAAVSGASLIMATALSPRRFLLENYSGMLHLAISEASLWNHSASNPDPALPLMTLEFLLQQEVERSRKEFDGMMKLVNDPKAKDIHLHSSSHLKNATLESKRNLLRRMHIVAKTMDLYKEVKSIEFLGLIGEEDAGKSTFIKNVIERVGAAHDSGVPQVGIDYHTDTVTPYKLRDQFYLVDFPGSNGTEKFADAWVQFTALPSSCILLLSFKGDMKKEQVQTYKQMQKGLGSKIVVVFNKVDQLYTPKVEKVYTKKYFENHRMKSAKLLDCDGKDVHYVCLDPDPEERLPKLRAVGVLGFEELADKLGKWLEEHSGSKSHQVLKDCLKTPKTIGNS